MTIHRTKSIGAKVTADEFAALECAAGGRRLGEWAREVLLAEITSNRTAETLLAEFLAVRTILLNLHYAALAGEKLTPESMQRFIDRADTDKARKARERLAPPNRKDR